MKSGGPTRSFRRKWPGVKKWFLDRLRRLKPRREPRREDILDLTPREREIARLLLEGISKNQICERLCIAPNTLKNHTRSIRHKLHLKKLADIGLYYRWYAENQGLFPPEDS